MQDVKFDIQDMHCGSCVNRVTAAIQLLDGVSVTRVAVGSADLSFDPAKTSAPLIATAITAAGFPATEATGQQRKLGVLPSSGGCCSG